MELYQNPEVVENELNYINPLNNFFQVKENIAMQ